MKLFSDISFLWLIPLAIICFVIVYFFYKKEKLIEFNRSIKIILIIIRSLAFLLLFILLFEITFQFKETKIEKPLFINLTDNSSSLLNYSDSNYVINNIKNIHQKIKEKFKDKFEFRNYIVGKNVRLDSVSLDESVSNLNAGFDFIYNKYFNNNIGAICFISDGNFNIGSSPLYGSEKIKFTPIFSIGVGDTIIKRDQLLRNVSVNNIAFYKNKFPIEVNIEASKMGKVNTELSLWKDQQKIDSKVIKYNDGDLDFINTSFMVDANDIGFNAYTVRLKKESNESSYENNTRTFYIEVIDSRSKILLLADAPHPDISAIKQELEKDEIIDVSTSLINKWNGELNPYSLVIWHNPTEKDKSVLKKINESKIPVLYILGNQSSNSLINEMDIGVNLPLSKSIDQAQGIFSNDFKLFEISDKLKKSIKIWPPLSVPFGRITQNQNEVLIKQKIGEIIKNTPILYFTSFGNQKIGVFIGEGIWRWKLSDYLQYNNSNSFNELIQKLIQYLTIKKNTEPLRINLPKIISKNEPIIINAEFYNSSFESITEPDIQLSLFLNNKIYSNYTFAKKTSNYKLNLGTLKEGFYNWNASSTYNGKKIIKSGSFIVENSSIEDVSTHADHNILEQIAFKSNGSFYSLKNTKNLLTDIDKRKDIVNISYQESNFSNLIDWKVLFFIISSLFILEWFIRRYNGSY